MARDLNKEDENNEQYKLGYKEGRSAGLIDGFMRSWDPFAHDGSPHSKGYEKGLRDQSVYGRIKSYDDKPKPSSKSSYSNTSSRNYSSEESDSDDDDDDSDETETKPKVKRIDVLIEILKRMSKEKKKEIKEELRNMSKEDLELNCLYGRVYYEGIPRVSESGRDEIKEKLRNMNREDLELNYLLGVSIPLLAQGVLLEARPNMKDRDGKSRQNRRRRLGEMFSKRLDSMSKEEIKEIKKKIDSDSISEEEINAVLYGRKYYQDRPSVKKSNRALEVRVTRENVDQENGELYSDYQDRLKATVASGLHVSPKG